MVTVFEPLLGKFMKFESEVAVAKCIGELNAALYKDGYLDFNDWYDILIEYDQSRSLVESPRPLMMDMFGITNVFDTGQVFTYRKGEVCGKTCYVMMYPTIGSRWW